MENPKVNKERVNYNKKTIPVISKSNLIASIFVLIPFFYFALILF